MILSKINNLAESAEYRQNIITPEDLAGYCGTIENGQTFKSLSGDRGVGTFGGSEDHTAILLSRPNQLVQYAYCPVRHEKTISFPADHIFAIASSGVIAEKTGSAMASYNNASLRARAVLAEWNAAAKRSDATLADAIQAAGGPAPIQQALAHSHHADFPAKNLLDRFNQFYAENNQIIPAFAEAIQATDWRKLGTIIDQSQLFSETQLKNQVPQTVYLARVARELGASAASAFGAGFGGSVWALIPSAESKEFRASWEKLYAAQYPDDATRANFFTTRPGPAAFQL
jgi:galactokinase